MPEEKIEDLIRDFIAALEESDLEKGLSFFTEDATWVTPEGTFKGKKELERYLRWMSQTVSDLAVTDVGIGIMVQGNKAVYEHRLAGTSEGMRAEMLAMCVYEFSDDKIQHLRTVYDRLSLTKQAAKGWFAKRVVSSVVKRAEKGLR